MEKKIEHKGGRLHASKFLTLAEAGVELVDSGKAPAGAGAAQMQIRLAVGKGEIPTLHKLGKFFLMQKADVKAWIKALDIPGRVDGKACYSSTEAIELLRRKRGFTKAGAKMFLIGSKRIERAPFVYFLKSDLDKRIAEIAAGAPDA